MSGLPLNLDDLLHTRAVESNRVEFKATWNLHIKLATLQTVCAFANDLLNLNGGYVVLGVRTGQDGAAILPPEGLQGLDVDKIQREIRGQCNRIDPVYQPVLFPEIFQGKQILIIWAPGGDNRPYQAPLSLEGGDRAYFVRQGPETVLAKGDVLRQLLERAARIPFDDRRNNETRIEDISPTLVRRFLADVRSDLVLGDKRVDDRELYRKIRIVSQVNDHEVPRNVGLLFFNEKPENYFPGARVDVVQFADDTGGDLIEERKITGPLAEQIRFTLEYLNSLSDVLLEKVPGRAEVDRTVAYPYEAMEEAIVNAIYHRSYEESREPAKLYLYPGRMEIISYPGPVPGIERRDLQAGHAVPPVPARNRRIGEFLKELRLAEGRGTGLPKIRRKMQENGSPEPIFDFDDARSYFRVTLPVHPRYHVLHALRESARLWAIGERAGALAHLERAFEQQSSSGFIAGQLIEYAAGGDDFERARRVFDRFHTQSHKSEAALPYLRFAKALLDHNEVAAARTILQLIPPQGSSEDLFEAAILRKKAKDYQEAHRILAQVYATRMDDPRVIHEFAQTKLALARSIKPFPKKNLIVKKRLTSEAVELLHRTLQLATDPVRKAWCYFDLARALDWLREPATQVEAAYLQARSLLPDEPRFQEFYKHWKDRQPQGARSRT